MKTPVFFVVFAGFVGLFAIPPIRAGDGGVTNTPPRSVADFPADKGLRMNFRNVPLETVLDYLSEAAGFIIHIKPGVEVTGKVNVWSDQPLDKDESVALLEQVLADNGFAVIRNGRMLTILKSDDAKKSDIPVHKGVNPSEIPQNPEVVTQVIPVHSLNVMQLPKDLASILPPTATLTANEAGNSLIMTDNQADIHHFTEIIQALDSAGSAANTLKVFPLKYADAKTLAEMVKELFPAPETSPTGAPGAGAGGGNVAGRFRGGGGNGGRGGGGGGGGGGGNNGAANLAAMAAMFGAAGAPGPGAFGGNASGEGSGHTPTTRVTAVGDDYSNSLIVSAPDSLIPTLEELVASIDVSIEDSAEMRVFHLKNADPTEMSDLLSNLFPDESKPAEIPAFAGQFGFPGVRAAQFAAVQRQFNNQNNAAASSGQSERMKKMGRVTSVADRRTSSLVVTAAKNLMPQIAAMIAQLDADPANQQHVHVFPLQNAEPQDVQNSLQDIFPAGNNTRANSQLNNDPLNSRSQTYEQQQQSTINGLNNNNSAGGSGSRGGRGF